MYNGGFESAFCNNVRRPEVFENRLSKRLSNTSGRVTLCYLNIFVVLPHNYVFIAVFQRFFSQFDGDWMEMRVRWQIRLNEGFFVHISVRNNVANWSR